MWNDKTKFVQMSLVQTESSCEEFIFELTPRTQINGRIVQFGINAQDANRLLASLQDYVKNRKTNS